MRYKAVIGCVLIVSALLLKGRSAQTEEQPSLAKTWEVTAVIFGAPIYLRLELNQHGEALTGTSNGDKLEGSVKGTSIDILIKPSSLMKDGEGGMEELRGTLQNGTISGLLVWTEADNPTHPTSVRFSARPALLRRTGPPRRYEFKPAVYYRQFSALKKPVLVVWPGDTIHTTTLDARGVDAEGIRRAMRGNPQTGPFYVATAMPGETLVVHLKRLQLNRNWAFSYNSIVNRAQNIALASKMKYARKSTRWNLDFAKGVAFLENPGEHLAHYSVPLRPMLGCIAVAPNSSQAAPASGDSGNWGGNMDFNEIVEGATVYLPVETPGALLYVGDGHAAQGDGELNGDALETSMDVELTVDVIPGEHIPSPRVESPVHISAMGIGGSLDDALRTATENMVQWLEDKYKLTPSETAEVLGTAAEYEVSEVADRNVGIVLRIDKKSLETLAPRAN